MGSLPRLRPRFEVAQILRDHAADYRARHVMTEEQRRAAWAIVHCRTAALGGHLDRCDTCDYARPAYNSCRHRACPKCQGQRQQEWIAKQVDRALAVAYSHLVFTLPAELRPVARANPREVYRILFAAASRTVLRLAKDPRHLGAQVGITAVLHTWTQSLHYHPHVHLIVTASGLSQDGQRWVPNRWGERYLFPVRALSRAFRSSFVRALVRARGQGKLAFVGQAAELASDDGFADLKRGLYAKDWVVYAKRPFPGVRQLYRYLGRYTHRVGLSNSRLLSVDEQSVTIRTRAGAASFPVHEFLRRFLQHVPPKGFVRVRHFGLFASAHKTRLLLAQKLLGHTTADDGAPESTDVPSERPEEPCPACLFGSLVREDVDPDSSFEDLWDP